LSIFAQDKEKILDEALKLSLQVKESVYNNMSTLKIVMLKFKNSKIGIDAGRSAAADVMLAERIEAMREKLEVLKKKQMLVDIQIHQNIMKNKDDKTTDNK